MDDLDEFGIAGDKVVCACGGGWDAHAPHDPDCPEVRGIQLRSPPLQQMPRPPAPPMCVCGDPLDVRLPCARCGTRIWDPTNKKLDLLMDSVNKAIVSSLSGVVVSGVAGKSYRDLRDQKELEREKADWAKALEDIVRGEP